MFKLLTEKKPPATYIIVIKEHSQLSHTDTQICFIELIGNVPAQRSKFPALLYNTMEKAEPEQQFLPGMLQKEISTHILALNIIKSRKKIARHTAMFANLRLGKK